MAAAITKTEVLESQRKFENDRPVFTIRIRALVDLEQLQEAVRRWRSEERLAEHFAQLQRENAELKAQLRDMHQRKTGALLLASVVMGAACAGATASALAALQTYGGAIGLAFQVVDDILDVTADSATLGKTAGKDAAQDKPTYVSLLGLERSRVHARELYADAIAALDASGLADIQALRALADMVVNRNN